MIKNDFPEFIDFMPEGDNRWWWKKEDRESRINCLLLCIEMSK